MSRQATSRSRPVIPLLLGLVLLSTALYGAGFWDKKDFKQWNPREVERMYRDSPWSKRVTIPLSAPTAGFSSAGGPGGARGAGGAGAAGPGAGGGRPRGAGAGGQMPQQGAGMNLQVRFDQAAPIKHAKIKFSMGESTELTPQMQQFLDAQEPYYVIAVEGLPTIFARFEDMPEQLATTARLRRKKKDDLYPAKVDVAPGQNRRTTLLYYFPQADPIVLDDKEVEFFLKFERSMMASLRPQGRQGAGGQRGQGQGGQRPQGQRPQGQQRQQGGQGAGRPGGQGNAMAMALFGREIKRKFRLKDMVYNGELAL